MNIHTASVDSVMLYFEPIISEEVLDRVQRAYQRLKNVRGIIDLAPSYNSILIHYDLHIYDDKSIQNTIIEVLEKREEKQVKLESKLITIPTHYDKIHGMDIAHVAQYNGLSIEEVIALHTQTLYRVYAIGFMVGFAYLAAVDPKIATPRLTTPRAKVPKGSVAIADNQTAIYPKDSAGGWNIIGYTEFNNFNQFEVGDRVQFVHVKNHDRFALLG